MTMNKYVTLLFLGNVVLNEKYLLIYTASATGIVNLQTDYNWLAQAHHMLSDTSGFLATILSLSLLYVWEGRGIEPSCW